MIPRFTFARRIDNYIKQSLYFRFCTRITCSRNHDLMLIQDVNERLQCVCVKPRLRVLLFVVDTNIQAYLNMAIF